MKLIYAPNDTNDKRQTIIIEEIIASPQKYSLLQQDRQLKASKIIIKYPQENGTTLAISFYKEDMTTPLKTFYVICSQSLPTNEGELISLVNAPCPESTPSLIKRSTNIINTVCIGATGMMSIYCFGFLKGSLFASKDLMRGYLYQTIQKNINDLPNPSKYRFKKGLKIYSTLLTLQGFTTLFSLFYRRRHDSYILDSQGSRTDISLKAAKHLFEEIISQNTSALSIKPGLLFIKNSGFCRTIGHTDFFDFCQFTLNQLDDNLSSSQNTQDLVQYKAPEAPSYFILDHRPGTLWSWLGQAFNDLLNGAIGYASDYFAEDTSTAVGFSLQDTLHSLGEILIQGMAQPEFNATLAQGINDCLMQSCYPPTHCSTQRLNNGTLFPENPSSL